MGRKMYNETAVDTTVSDAESTSSKDRLKDSSIRKSLLVTRRVSCKRCKYEAQTILKQSLWDHSLYSHEANQNIAKSIKYKHVLH